jgi:adenosine kinase
MLLDKGNVGVLGSVGNDNYGDLYEKLLKEESILPLFERFNEVNTGVCAVYCHNKDRGHVTDLGASTLVSQEFVQKIWDSFKNTELIYTELFILKHRKNIVYMLAELGTCDRKIFGFNLPSFYFIETFLEDIKALFEHADIVFTNAAEAIFFGTHLMINDSENLSELCVQLAKFPKKNKTKKRIVVITCGPNPAHIAEYDHLNNSISYSEKHVPDFVDEELIVDTNGAGDAFAGGFLAKYVKGESLGECAKAGHWAAAMIIQRRGCQLPLKCEYIDSSLL